MLGAFAHSFSFSEDSIPEEFEGLRGRRTYRTLDFGHMGTLPGPSAQSSPRWVEFPPQQVTRSLAADPAAAEQAPWLLPGASTEPGSANQQR